MIDPIKFKLRSLFGSAPERDFERKVGGSLRKIAHAMKNFDKYYLPKWVEKLNLRPLLEKGSTLDEILRHYNTDRYLPFRALLTALSINDFVKVKGDRYYLNPSYDKMIVHTLEVPEFLEDLKGILDTITENFDTFIIRGMSDDVRSLLYSYLQRTNIHRSIIDYIIRRWDVTRFKRILDVGSGIGFTTFSILEHYPNVEMILGFDVYEPAVNIARRVLESRYKWALDKVSFVVSTLEDLVPEYRDFFDAAFAMLILPRVEDPVSFLRNLRLVLRPGGSLFIVNPVRGGGSMKLMPCVINVLTVLLGAKSLPPASDQLESYLTSAGFDKRSSMKLVVYMGEWVRKS